MITTKSPDTFFDIPAETSAEVQIQTAQEPVADKSAATEQALKSASKIHKLILPFLVQNIGWFISGFLFITGCIFLVINTEGALRTFTISSILFGYTLLLMGGAYKLLKHRPELRTTCTVLMTIGMLLIPLSMAASVRLISGVAAGPVMIGAGIVMLLINLVVFRWSSALASGIVDRSLSGIHPKLFIGLTAIQIAAPLVNLLPGWFGIAFFHLLLCGILGTGLLRFTNDWVKSVYSHRRMTAFYALGTLVYAAAVSFFHLILQQKTPLPAGYSAPFLMLLSGFLFYADARFKQWVNQYTFLSKLSFGIYGLSVGALAIGFNTPFFGTATLLLGAAVYGTVFAQYLTLPPLTFLVICLGGLYYQFLLRFLPYDTWFLAGLPGLALLAGMVVKAAQKGAEKIVRLGFRTIYFLASALIVWSLFLYGTPGLTATASGMAFTLLLYAALRYPPKKWINKENTLTDEMGEAVTGANLLATAWLYTLPLSAAMTLAYLPAWPGFNFFGQFSVTLGMLAAVLTETGIRFYRKQTEAAHKKAEIILNSALFSAVAAGSICLWNGLEGIMLTSHAHLALPFISAVFFRQGLVLRLRFPVYLGLMLGGFSGRLIKSIYFSHVSTGMTALCVMVAVWLLLRNIRKKAAKQNDAVFTPSVNPVNILWGFRTGRRSIADTVVSPLNKAIVVLWGYGIFRFITRLPLADITLFQLMNTGLAMSATFLMLCHFRKFSFWWMPLVLGAASLTASLLHVHGINPPLIMFVISIYATGIWSLTQWALSRPGIMNFSLTPFDQAEKNRIKSQIDAQTRRISFLMTFFTLFITSCFWFVAPGAKVLPAMLTGTAFFWASGHYYGKPVNIYFMLAMSVFMTLILFADFLALTDIQQIMLDSRTRLLTAVLSFVMGLAAWLISAIQKAEAGNLYRLPLLRIASLLGGATVSLQFTLTLLGLLTGSVYLDSLLLSIAISLLLPVSLFQTFRLHPTSGNAHALLLSLLSLLTFGTGWLGSTAHLPLMLAVWCLLLLSLEFGRKRLIRAAYTLGLSKQAVILVRTDCKWLSFCSWLVMPAMLFLPMVSFAQTLLTLLLLTLCFGVKGWDRRQPFLMGTARVLGLVLLHTWPVMFLPSGNAAGMPLWQIVPLLKAQFARLQVLFPWYALQTVLAVLALSEIRRRLLKRMPENEMIRTFFFANMRLEMTFALGAWFLHAGVFIQQIANGVAGNFLWIQGEAALTASILFIGMGIRRGWRTQNSKWIYASFYMAGAAGVYLRLLLTGFAPLNQWDTMALMSAAWGLFMVQRSFKTEFLATPLRRLVMVTPLLALITMPFQAESVHTSATLLAAGSLYLSVYYTIGGRLPLILGMISANAAAYLWIPAWAERSQLVQPYAVPAALSVLFLLQLHRNELKRHTLNRMRLVALSVLYTCATLDFFMQPDNLTNFILALALSLAGVGAGIAFRIRAFLYGGTTFMVLNVLGQLFLVYSAQNFSKGIVLVLLGTITMIGMIGFNLKREAILKKVRVFRADLEEWE